jgi:Mu-like prophage I protein
MLADARAPGVFRKAGGYLTKGTLYGVTSRLGAVPIEVPANDVEIPEVKWINVANEGEYLGHHQGGFELTREIMGQLVGNLRRSPKYKPGTVTLPDGSTITAGSEDVVQYDYEHASEMAPWEGSIPLSGAPAMGWVWDLEIRQSAGGRSQLWALSWLGEQIRGQIRRREYKWVSIAWNPNGVHWVTGEPIGALLTSIAFTNHPFLQDLAELAARAANGTAGQARQTRLPSRAHASEAYAASTRPNSNPGSSTMDPTRNRLCAIFRIQAQADDDSIIRAAENAASSGGTLAAVLAAFGVADPQALMDASKELPQVRQKLADALAELDSLGRADAVADEAMGQTDVAAALSARGWVRNGFADPTMINALSAHRGALIAAEVAKLPKGRDAAGDQRQARERGRQAFLASYGVNQNPATQHLTQTFVAGPGQQGGSTQFPAPVPAPGALPVQFAQPGGLVALPGATPQRQPLQLVGNGGPQPGAIEAVDIAAFSGRNTTERVMSYLSSVDQGFGKLERGVQVKRASEWRRQYEAQHGPLAA